MNQTLQYHTPSTREVMKYVDWYHRKFRNPYYLVQFPTIKVDHEAIISVVDKYDMRTFLEIGTWKGYTALLVYLYRNIERVKCIDIHDGMADYDHAVNKAMARGDVGEYFRNTFVDLVFADTMTYPKDCEQYDFVFIDGNHDYEHVKNDTLLALSMNPKIIMWHDYRNGNDDVTKFIDELIANGSSIIQFQEGSCCVAAIPENIKFLKAEVPEGIL